jgi:hypothetical protein
MNSRNGRTRTVLPLPAYTKRKPLQGGRWGYYFEPPSWARNVAGDDERGACPVVAEALGEAYDPAVQRVERVLLPQFHSWRTGGVSDLTPENARVGTLTWLFAEYRTTDKFKKLSRGQRGLHEAGFALVGKHTLKDGRELGSVGLAAIDTGAVDRLYEKLLPMRDAEGLPIQAPDENGAPLVDKHGEPVILERRTTINHAMKSCRRAWNVVYRLHRSIVPGANPFARMGLVGAGGTVTEATYAELLAAVAAADRAGVPSLAAAFMVTWEWLQREDHIFTAFRLDHYRPKDRPDDVKVVHPKTGAEVWIPLFDVHAGARIALFPELMARMDALKRDRVGGGLFFMRDWVDRAAKIPVPWSTARGGLDLVRERTKGLLRAASIREEVSFTSFRHGGFTELGDAELTDAQIRALSRQKSSKIVQGYVKRTQRQIVEGTKRRRAIRPAPAAAASEVHQLAFAFGDPAARPARVAPAPVTREVADAVCADLGRTRRQKEPK